MALTPKDQNDAAMNRGMDLSSYEQLKRDQRPGQPVIVKDLPGGRIDPVGGGVVGAGSSTSAGTVFKLPDLPEGDHIVSVVAATDASGLYIVHCTTSLWKLDLPTGAVVRLL